MSEPFIAEIKIFAGNFAPRGWAFCDGQYMPIQDNTALFSLIQTTYGGDGRTSFALPNLMGRAPMHPGQGTGLHSRRLGDRTGTETVILDESQLPSHSHAWNNGLSPSDSNDPEGRFPSRHVDTNMEMVFKENPTLDTQFSQAQLSAVGGQPHENRQPFLVLNFIIALMGIYPPRS